MTAVNPNINKRIEEWKKRLIDLSKRNKFLSWSSSKSNLIVIKPDINFVFDRLILQEKSFSFWVPPVIDETEEESILTELDEESIQKTLFEAGDQNNLLKEDELLCNRNTAKSLVKTLKNAFKLATSDYEEKGLRTLYIAFGSLDWNHPKYGEISSPLALCPIELSRETVNSPFYISLAEDDLFLNPVLSVVLKQDFDITLPDIPENFDEKNITDYLNDITKHIQAMEWLVKHDVMIGRLSFHKFSMYQDLEANQSIISDNSLARALSEGKYTENDSKTVPDVKELDKIQLPENTFQILDADSSQQQCIQASLRGKNFVLQGPPGSGKSQTIANIIAEFIAIGKTVLFVSEKIAALEVVQKRLQQEGLGDLCLELHSSKANRKEVINELLFSLEHSFNTKNKPTQSEFEKLKILRKNLNNYATAINLTREPFGESVYRILAKISKFKNVDIAPVSLLHKQGIDLSKIQELKELIKRFSALWHVYEQGDDFLWKDCVETNYSNEIKLKIESLLSSLSSELDNLKSASDKFKEETGIETISSIHQINNLIEIGNHLNKIKHPYYIWLSNDNLLSLIEEAEQKEKFSYEYFEKESYLEERYYRIFVDENNINLESLSEKINALPNFINFDDLNVYEYLHIELSSLEAILNSINNNSLNLLSILGLNINNLQLAQIKGLIKVASNSCCKQKLEKKWFESDNTVLLRKLLETSSHYYSEYNLTKKELLALYRDDIINYPIDKITDIIKNTNNLLLKDLILFTISNNDNFDFVNNFVSSEKKELEAIINNSKKLIGYFGINQENTNLEKIKRIAKIATYSCSECRPEENWFNPHNLNSLKALIETAKPIYIEYKNIKEQLLKTYEEDFLSLVDIEIKNYIEKFSSFFYKSAFKHINLNYHKDIKYIKGLTKNLTLPVTIIEDLLKLRDLNKLSHQLFMLCNKQQVLLGNYFEGNETNIENVEKAYNVAQSIFDIAGYPIPEKILKYITVQAIDATDIYSLGSNILNKITNFEKKINEFNEIATHNEFETYFNKINEQIEPDQILYVLNTLNSYMSCISDIRELNLNKCLSNETINDFNLIINFNSCKEKLNKEIEPYSGMLGEHFNFENTDLDFIKESLTVIDLTNTYLSSNIHDSFVDLLNKNSQDLSQIANILSIEIEKFENSKQKINEIVKIRLKVFEDDTEIIQVLSWLKSTIESLSRFNIYIKEILNSSKENYEPTLSNIKSDLNNKNTIMTIRNLFEESDDKLKNTFGDRFIGINTDWNEIISSLNWTIELQRILNSSNIEISEKLSKLITCSEFVIPDKNILERDFKDFSQTFNAFKQLFSCTDKNINGQNWNNVDICELDNYFNQLKFQIEDLKLWVDFKRIRQNIINAGLQDFLVHIENYIPASADLPCIFEKSVYYNWIESIFENDPLLKEFSGKNHFETIKEFKKLDKRLIKESHKFIIENCNKNMPSSTSLQFKGTEIQVLRNEGAKKRRHLSIRRLFERVPNLITKLRPCLMMSPLSVSQFLQPDKISFDLVIFDEASQIFTEDAIGSIYRGKQLIVAGDSKQLPPTDFFKTLDSDDDRYAEEDDSEEISSADYKSVLDELGTIFPQQQLRWHYRSKHESLIAFSNNRFYNNKLVTFPSALYESPELGIKFEYIENGIFDKGGKRNNIEEAKKVAEIVFEHFTNYPQKTLGVIAFSKSQEEAIRDAVELKRKQKPDYECFFVNDRLDGFFIKNLENVQGDERDVIIFSIGYGKDQHGRISYNFGPLNKSGGERRLNVAITRAKEKVVLVSSIKASDFNIASVTNEGVLNLHKYLEVAEIGIKALETSNANMQGEADSPFEEDVASEIKSMGYDVALQVGCSGYRIDIAVIDPANPGRYVLAVECDGATYHSAATARDRDRLRQQILEELGWKVHRIWSTDWFYHRNHEMNRLKEAIIKARESYDNNSICETLNNIKNNSHVDIHVEKISSEDENISNVIPGTKIYELTSINKRYCPDTRAFENLAYNGELKDRLNKFIYQESPIHLDLLIKRVSDSCGFTRTGSKIKSIIIEQLRNSSRLDNFKVINNFIWHKDKIKPLAELEVRIPDQCDKETCRNIEHISHEEIQAALLLISEHALGISPENLLTETARLFGFNRMTENIRSYIENCYDDLIRENYLDDKTGSVCKIS